MLVRTISDHYVKQNRILHESISNYGSNSAKWLPKVISVSTLSVGGEILDYGCGKGSLVKALLDNGFRARGYDPAVDEFSQRPEPAEIVVCTDVLEHVEPEFVKAVLDDLESLAKVALYVIVSTHPAKKILPDGRNAHLTIKTANEWLYEFLPRWKLAHFSIAKTGFDALLTK